MSARSACGGGLLVALVVAVSAPGAAAAPIPVTNDNDSGAGSLRAAVAAANPGDTVVVQPGIGTITLTSGEIPVTKSITVQGAGESTTVISGNHSSRAFCLQAPACPAAPSGTQPALTLADLKITAGKFTAGSATGGGAVFSNGGPITLSRVRLTNNTVTFGANSVAGGGALFSFGAISIENSTIVNNSVTGGPAASAVDGGGGVYAGGPPITITNSRVDGNTVKLEGGSGASLMGGGGVYSLGGEVTVTNSTISGNSATSSETNGSVNGGGGIYNAGGPITVTDSHVDDNRMKLTDVPGFDDGGGGIANLGGLITLTRSTASGNSLDMITGGTGSVIMGGGGVWNLGPVTAVDSTLADNIVAISGAGTNMLDLGGGAIFALGNVTLTRSTIGPNNAASIAAGAGTKQVGGGGVYDNGGTTGAIVDSTLVENQLIVTGAPTNAGGGAFYVRNNNSLTNATLARNSATGVPGGGIFADAGTTTLKNTILAGNTAATGVNCAGTGTFASAGGNNLESANTCGLATTDLHDTDPLLGPLGAHGGPTLTLALLAGSPAINSGDNGVCPAVDQRGVARPNGPACDIGAYELGPPTVVTGDASGITLTGATVTGTVNPNLRAATYFFEFGPTPAYGLRTATQNAGAGNAAIPASATLGGLTPGTTYHYRLVGINEEGTSLGTDRTLRTGSLAAQAFNGVQLRRLTIRIRGNSAIFPILCPVGPCSGRIDVQTAAKLLPPGKVTIAAKRKKKRLKVGAARFTAATGQTANVKVKLTSAARKLIARKGKLKVIAKITSSSNGVTKKQTARVTLKGKKKKR